VKEYILIFTNYVSNEKSYELLGFLKGFLYIFKGSAIRRIFADDAAAHAALGNAE
jgi:hypothetical protein